MEDGTQAMPKDPSPVVEEPPPVIVSLSRSGRRHKKPSRFVDFLPSNASVLPLHMRNPPPIPLLSESNPSPATEILPLPDNPRELPSETIEMEPNTFGLYRVYSKMPSCDPEEDISLDSVCDSHGLAASSSLPNPLSGFGIPTLTGNTVTDETLSPGSHAPFLNKSIFYLMSWFYSGSNMKSVAELDRLVNEVLLKEDFNARDLKGFKAAAETKRMDKSLEQKDGNFTGFDGWSEATVQIKLPAGDSKKGGNEASAPLFDIPGVWQRNLVEAITSAWQDDAALAFHLQPYKLFYKSSVNEPAQRVHGEAYTSETFLQMNDEIAALPREPGCTLEQVVSPIMLWSDSTHLTNFGNASMWPVYMQIANESKYTRAKPTAFASHHLAYLPSVRFIFSLQ
jgi:hypothetical protein